MKKFFLFAMMAVVGMSAMAQWTVQGIPYNNPKAKMPIMKAMPMATANDSFSFDDIQNWTGEGENQAAVVIQFNTGKESETNALVFGYRWNGTATGTDMIVAIAKEDPRFYVLANNGSYGYSIGGIGWDADEDGDIYLKNGDQTFTLTDGKYECSSEYDYDNFTAGDADDLWAGGWFTGYWSYWVASDTPANFGYSGVGASGRELTDGCWDGWNFSANYGSYAWLPFAAAPSLIPAGATTQFKVDGIYYTLDSYQKKTVMVSVPFEMENQEKTTYAGDIKIPSTFTQEDVVYTVVGIADDAFAGVQIGEVELPETVTAIGKRAFQNSTLTSINVTDNITKIGVAAFSGCSKLTEYKLPTSLKSIPDELYKGTAITAVTFSETIESIGVSAFENCTKIETLDIPATLKAIGTGAFAGCDGLKNVKVKTIFPLAITEDIFSVAAYENATLIVPVGYTAVYATSTGWKNFKKVEEVAISVAQGDNFYVGNVAYTITECSEAGNKVMVTYFPVESVSDNNIKAANLIGYVGDVVVPAKVSYQNIEFTVDGITAQAFMGAEEMTSIKFNCVLTSIPERAMFSCKKLTSLEIPTTVTSIESKAFEQCQALTTLTLPQGLLNIGSRAFYYCMAIESLNIPSTVTTIGDYAFAYCEALKTIEFPEIIIAIPANVCYSNDALESVKLGSKVESIGANAFQSCTSLKVIELPNTLTTIGNYVLASTAIESIVIPEGVTVIPNRAFENTPLKSVTMSDKVTSIGDYVFQNCSAIETIKLPSSLVSLGASVFSGCSVIKTVTIPEGVTAIKNYTFQNCVALESVNLPAELSSIGTYVFKGCTALKSITVPQGVTTISNYTFQNCTALESVTLGSGLKSINQYAFSGCSALQTISIPESVTSIGTYVFNGCTALKSITVPQGVTTISNYTFQNCSALESVTLGSNVKSINQYAFSGCSSLQAISIPESVISIGTYVFNGCTALKSITVPQGVTTINNYTFQNCTALESVTLGNKVKTLGNYAFYGCSSLKVIELPETISTLGSNLTVGATNLSVYVCNATPFAWNNSFKVSDEAYAPIYVVYGAKADYNAANNWNLSAVNEVVPTIAVDMENKVNVLNYEVASFAVPMTYTYEESVPTRFIEANNTIVEAEADVVVKFKKVIEKGVSLQDLEGYTSVEAQLNEDGTYSADLLRYLEPNTKYEYHWEFVLGNNEPVVGAVDYFTTSDMITEVENIGVSIDNAEYYNMQGVKVAYPTNGIFIMKQGNKTIKVIR